MDLRSSIRFLHFAAMLVAASCCAEVAADEPSVDLFEQGVGYFQQGQSIDARAALGAFIAANPDDSRLAQARYLTGETLLRDAQPAEAVAAFRAALAANPAAELAAAARFRLGEALYLAKAHADAVVELGAFCDEHRDHAALPRALYYLGEAAYAAGEYAAAERALAWRNAAFADDDLAERSTILAACSLARLSNPQQAWQVLAPTYWEQKAAGNFALAELAASLLIAAGSDEDAVAVYEQLLKQTTDAARKGEILATIVELHRRRNRLDEASEAVAAAIAIAEGERRAALLDLAAQLALERGAPVEAATAWERLVDEFPRHPLAAPAQLQLGELAAEDGNWEQAAARYAAICDLTDADSAIVSSAWVARLQALAQDRRWSDVVQLAPDAAKRITDRAGLAEVAYLRGRAHLGRAELDAARAAFAETLSIREINETEIAALAVFMTGETYFLQRRYADAVAEYRRVGEHKQPLWTAASLLQGGKCYEQLNRPDEALAVYDAVVRDHGDTPYAEEARGRREAIVAASAGKNLPARK